MALKGNAKQGKILKGKIKPGPKKDIKGKVKEKE